MVDRTFGSWKFNRELEREKFKWIIVDQTFGMRKMKPKWVIEDQTLSMKRKVQQVMKN